MFSTKWTILQLDHMSYLLLYPFGSPFLEIIITYETHTMK
jgi:hypothetical protein